MVLVFKVDFFFIIPWNAKVYQESITGNILFLVMSHVIRLFAQVEGRLRNTLARIKNVQQLQWKGSEGSFQVWFEFSHMFKASKWQQIETDFQTIMNTLAASVITWKAIMLSYGPWRSRVCVKTSNRCMFSYESMKKIADRHQKYMIKITLNLEQVK